MLLYQFTYYII